MLTITTRQTYLKALGFYSGAVDGVEGEKTRAAYRALQERYFTRAQDIDGLYGNNTDILLVNAYRVKVYCKDFRLEEFKCKCGGKYCSGYPAILNISLLKNLQILRDKYGATTIHSALRCYRHNAASGGAANSRHKLGKALDIQNKQTTTESKRKALMAYFRQLANSRYTYCNIGGNYPNMGNSVHIDVK